MRRLTKEVLLQPPGPGEPPHYVLMPYALEAGWESDFLLTVRSDDRDDDGVPDFHFGAVQRKDDWQHAAVTRRCARPISVGGS